MGQSSYALSGTRGGYGAGHGSVAVAFSECTRPTQFGVSILLPNMAAPPPQKSAVSTGAATSTHGSVRSQQARAMAWLSAWAAAAANGHVHVIQAMLMDRRVDPAVGGAALCAAAARGHTAVVAALLADGRVNPAANDGYALTLAAKWGHAEIVAALLADGRVNPAANDSYALAAAAGCGYTEVVAALLADERVNPAANDREALRRAAGKGHADVVAMLQQCPARDTRWRRRRRWLRAGAGVGAWPSAMNEAKGT
jgi:hypothetical protein